jgi:hypothetical protein
VSTEPGAAQCHHISTSAKRFVKLPHKADKPSGWMKLKEAKLLVIAAWDDFTAKRDLRPDDARGRGTLQFYYDLQDKALFRVIVERDYRLYKIHKVHRPISGTPCRACGLQQRRQSKT